MDGGPRYAGKEYCRGCHVLGSRQEPSTGITGPDGLLGVTSYVGNSCSALPVEDQDPRGYPNPAGGACPWEYEGAVGGATAGGSDDVRL